MNRFLNSAQLVQLLDRLAERWHQCPMGHDELDVPLLQASLLHGHNFALWHEEDLARAPGASDGTIGQVKRRIDPLNQCRNDAMEALDEQVLATLQAQGVTPTSGVPMHSETPGAIVDRLSILTLKIYHMREESLRDSASKAQRETCRQNLAVLEEQRTDLTLALGYLLEDLFTGRKRFKVYRQMKMYNDPALNPAIYRKGET